MQYHRLYIPYLYIIYGNINRYEARSVTVVVLQYLIAHSEKKSKDTNSSWSLVTGYSGSIAEPPMAAPDSSRDPDVRVAIQLATI